MTQKVVRVVLADDSKTIRLWIRKLLEKTPDIEVVGEARNGVEALRLVEDQSPDVLLLDIEMPLLDGIQVVEKLKNVKNETPILVLSNYANRDYIREMLAHGAAGYMVKERASERVVDAIREIARGRRGWINPKVS